MISNLDAMVREAKRRNVLVLLCGMKLPPNYGPEYTTQFERGYTQVAKRERAAFVPFLLEPIATDPAAEQDFPAYCRQTGHELVSAVREGDVLVFVIRKKA